MGSALCPTPHPIHHLSMTDQVRNRIDQALTRSLQHHDEHKGLFTAHIHLPIGDRADRIAILDELLNKLIRQYLKSLMVWENFITLETLLGRFIDGEKVMSFEAGETDDRCFRYLSTIDDRPVWVDRTGKFVADAEEPRNEVVPIYIERNVLPEKSLREAKIFYGRLDKSVRRRTEKTGFLLIGKPPQILINVNSREIKDAIRSNSALHPKDCEDTFKSSLNFERRPIVIINSSKSSFSSLKESFQPSHVINLLNADTSLTIRQPLSTFGRNEVILHYPDCNSLLVLSFGANRIDTDSIQRINSVLFNVNVYESADRSVIIHQEDLVNSQFHSNHLINWISDKKITNLFISIDETLRSYDSILHDILFRSYRFRELLSISISDLVARAVLNEILTGEHQLVPQYRGLNSYYLPNDQQTILRTLFSQLVEAIQNAYSSAFKLEKFDLIFISPFIAENSKFIELLPKEISNKISTINKSSSAKHKALICDYLFNNEIDQYKQTLEGDNVTLVWIDSFFKSNYSRTKRNLIELRLSDYDVHKHVLRDKLLTSEKSNQERLEAELSALKQEPILTIADLDLPENDDYANDQNRLRVHFQDRSYTVPASQKLLIKMSRSKWELSSPKEILDSFPGTIPNAKVEYIDVSSLEGLIYSKDSSQIINWRLKLRAEVEKSSAETVYQAISQIASKYDCRMVSKDWFVKDWLSNRSDNSIPNQKALLLVLGEFLTLDRHMLRLMHIQKLNEKLQQAEINRGALVFLRDVLNLTENTRKSKLYELAQRMMTSEYLSGGYNFFKKFISISKDDDDTIKEIIQLMSDIKDNMRTEKITNITEA